MKKTARNILVILAAAALLLPGTAASAAQPEENAGLNEHFMEDASWADIKVLLDASKDVIELGDASIIIEVNATDSDAGFQVFLDGDGWQNARVFDPDGRKVLHIHVAGGVKTIGGGTELFMESAEPEYEDLDGMQALINLLPEGEYYFLAKTTGGDWATGTAELTHDVPAGPEVVYPDPPDDEDECSTGVFVDSAYIEWDPVETDILGSGDIEIVAYQVIAEAEEGPERKFTTTVPAEVTSVTLPEEFLAEGTEFKFEVLAIEESGNQTITEGCFETEE